MAKKTPATKTNVKPGKQECIGCGATDYEGKLRYCPRCGSSKCSRCDMGDDVECASCPADDCDIDDG